MSAQREETRAPSATAVPDYDLAPTVAADTPQRMKALGNSLRWLLLDLVLERSMSVTELAARVGRPRGSVAHHVGVLVDAGLLRVVRTRKVRAVVERFYGRTARTILVEALEEDDLPFFRAARQEVDVDAMRAGTECGGFTMRHARIPAVRAHEFFQRVNALAVEFIELHREGDREFAFLAGVFPTHRPVSPRVRKPS